VDNPALQMRLDFGDPEIDVSATAHLFGLTIVLDSPRPDAIASYLRKIGINPRQDDNLGLVCTTSDLVRLPELSHHVRLTTDELLTPLYKLACHPAATGESAMLELINGALWLRWFDGVNWYDEELPPKAAGALVTSDLPFVATQPAWDTLQSATFIPARIATCSITHEGYIEIATTKPQLLEASAIPGLWRDGPTRYGAALAYADQLRNMPGIDWAGPEPEDGVHQLHALPLQLSSHHHMDLPQVVSELSRTGGRMICWGPGLGRRVVALAAVESLDAWPLLIISPPWGMWAWYRQVKLFGHTVSFSSANHDVRLMTYSDLALGAELDPASSIIFDDLTGEEASTDTARNGIRRLDGYTQSYRIGLTSAWPDDLSEACDIMDAVRPGEFRIEGQALATRYPLTPEARATEHLQAYLSFRRHSDPGSESVHRFRHSQVRTVTPAEAELDYHDAALSRLVSGESATAVLRDVLEVVSSGPPQRLSRKVGAALAAARIALSSNRRVVVLTNQLRSARLLASSLGHDKAQVFNAADISELEIAPGQVAIIVWQTTMPTVPATDEVIVCDYPWSFAELDNAIGPPSGPGPSLVSVLHSPGTVDDRIVMYAARRAELDPLGLSDSTPDEATARWLLRPRGLV
jgi:hypothetical protein